MLTGHPLSLPDCQQSSLCTPPSCSDVMRISHSAPTRRRIRRNRTLFTTKAIRRLEMMFEIDQYPDIHTREQLAEQIGVSEARIQVRYLA